MRRPRPLTDTDPPPDGCRPVPGPAVPRASPSHPTFTAFALRYTISLVMMTVRAAASAGPATPATRDRDRRERRSPSAKWPWAVPSLPKCTCMTLSTAVNFGRFGAPSPSATLDALTITTSGSSRHTLRIRTWVTASNHRRITAPHTRTFNHGAALGCGRATAVALSTRFPSFRFLGVPEVKQVRQSGEML